MKFRTEYEVKNNGYKLNPQKPIVATGSCFADNIVKKMRSCLWNASNPFGTLFNPLSIERTIKMCLFEKDADKIFMQSLFKDKEVYHSFLFDSSFSSLTKEDCLLKFNKCKDSFQENINLGKTLIITFGTAFCYFLADDSNYVVANCHKQPSHKFIRKKISVSNIVNRWERLITNMQNLIPDLKIIFTVSPVRHVRDGLHENNLSKSILLLAVNELCEGKNNIEYFPAYEILNDDLRDYRFYAEDLVHPTCFAIEYIWEKFKDSYIDNESKLMLKKGEAIVKRINHRHIAAAETEISTFEKGTRQLYNELHQQYPGMLELNVPLE